MSIGGSMINRGAQGAGTGAIAGGPWGALIGGGAGLGLGLFEGLYNDSNQRKARNEIEKAISQYGEDSQIVKDLLDSYYNGDYSLGTEQDVGKYRTELSKYNPEDYIYNDYEDFDKDSYTLQDYYDTNRGNQINAASNAVQAVAAGQGVGRGTAGANAVANAVVNKNSELTNEAYDRLTKDRGFDYDVWKNNIALNQNKLDALNRGNQYLLSQYNTLASDYMSNEADKIQNYMDWYNNVNNNMLNARLSKAGTYL